MAEIVAQCYLSIGSPQSDLISSIVFVQEAFILVGSQRFSILDPFPQQEVGVTAQHKVKVIHQLGDLLSSLPEIQNQTMYHDRSKQIWRSVEYLYLHQS